MTGRYRVGEIEKGLAMTGFRGLFGLKPVLVKRFMEMDIGDSFLFETNNEKEWQFLRVYASAFGRGREFILKTRKVDGGIRIFKVLRG